jgi:hypothetical protein
VSLSRETLARARAENRAELLSRGGPRNPDVLRVREADRDVVVKDFAARGPIVRRIAPWLVEREMRAYRQLAGHPAVPRLLARLDPLAFALEYRPGEILGPHLAGRIPKTFLGELREAVAGMHARGVVHLDLRHRSNTLADPDGHPVLIDFASALCFRPGSLAARWILPLLARLDRRAVEKWERRLAP